VLNGSRRQLISVNKNLKEPIQTGIKVRIPINRSELNDINAKVLKHMKEKMALSRKDAEHL
jgi:hypothetical protein